MGKKQAARKRKPRPPGIPVRVSSESDEEETSRPTAVTSSSDMPSPFHRVWSKENEITLLNSFLQFEQRDKGTDPLGDSRKGLNAFVTESLGGQFTKAQVSDKVKRLKKKFSRTSDRQQSPSFSPSHHEREIFELSEKIWGQSDAAASHHDMRQPKRRRKSRMVDDDIDDSKPQADATAVDSDVRSREKRVRKSDSKEDPVSNSKSKEGPELSSNSKEVPVPNSNSKEDQVPNSNSKEIPVPNSNSKEDQVLNSNSKEVPVPNSNSKEDQVLNSNSKEVPVPNSNSNEGPVPNSNSKEGPVLNSNLEFEKLDLSAVSDLLGKAVESLGQVGMDKRIKRLKKEIQVAELELFLKKGELLKWQLTQALESSGT